MAVIEVGPVIASRQLTYEPLPPDLTTLFPVNPGPEPPAPHKETSIAVTPAGIDTLKVPGVFRVTSTAIDGAALGDDRLIDGAIDGAALGFTDGRLELGMDDGMKDGKKDGTTVGAMVGSKVGEKVGEINICWE